MVTSAALNGGASGEAAAAASRPREFLFEPRYGLPIVRRSIGYAELLKEIRTDKVDELLFFTQEERTSLEVPPPPRAPQPLKYSIYALCFANFWGTAISVLILDFLGGFVWQQFPLMPGGCEFRYAVRVSGSEF